MYKYTYIYIYIYILYVCYIFALGHQRKRLPNAAVKTEEARPQTSSQFTSTCKPNANCIRNLRGFAQQLW